MKVLVHKINHLDWERSWFLEVRRKCYEDGNL